VDLDRVAVAPAEQLVHGRAERVAGEVERRHVDRRQRVRRLEHPGRRRRRSSRLHRRVNRAHSSMCSNRSEMPTRGRFRVARASASCQLASASVSGA
jgi:hypothetical protein